MAPNVYFGFLQYESFAAIYYWHQKLISSKCALFKNNLLSSDTVPLNRDNIFLLNTGWCHLVVTIVNFTIKNVVFLNEIVSLRVWDS